MGPVGDFLDICALAVSSVFPIAPFSVQAAGHGPFEAYERESENVFFFLF